MLEYFVDKIYLYDDVRIVVTGWYDDIHFEIGDDGPLDLREGGSGFEYMPCPGLEGFVYFADGPTNQFTWDASAGLEPQGRGAKAPRAEEP